MARALGLGRTPALPPLDESLPPPPPCWDLPSAIAWVRAASHTAADAASTRSARLGGLPGDPTAADPATGGPISSKETGCTPPPTPADIHALAAHVCTALLRTCRDTLVDGSLPAVVTSILSLARRRGASPDLFPSDPEAHRVLGRAGDAATGSAGGGGGSDPELATAPLWVPWRPGGRISAGAAQRRACASHVLFRGLLAPPDSLFKYLPGKWEIFQAEVGGILTGILASETQVLPAADMAKYSFRRTSCPVGVDGSIVALDVLVGMLPTIAGCSGACPGAYWRLALSHVPGASFESSLAEGAATRALSVSSSLFPVVWKLATAPHPSIVLRSSALSALRLCGDGSRAATAALAGIAVEAVRQHVLLLSDIDRITQLRAQAAAGANRDDSSAGAWGLLDSGHASAPSRRGTDSAAGHAQMSMADTARQAMGGASGLALARAARRRIGAAGLPLNADGAARVSAAGMKRRPRGPALWRDAVTAGGLSHPGGAGVPGSSAMLGLGAIPQGAAGDLAELEAWTAAASTLIASLCDSDEGLLLDVGSPSSQTKIRVREAASAA